MVGMTSLSTKWFGTSPVQEGADRPMKGGAHGRD